MLPFRSCSAHKHMSRSNPYKKKQRSAKKTFLIFGEGLSEETFVNHLKSLYARDTGVQVKVVRGKGGSADGMVADAARLFGDYDRRFVVLDDDKPKDEMDRARKEAKLSGIVVLEHRPCLESVLLNIADAGLVTRGKSSDWCKKEFESRFIEKKKRGELKEYSRFFPKSVLDRHRKNVTELEQLISVISGKWKGGGKNG